MNNSQPAVADADSGPAAADLSVSGPKAAHSSGGAASPKPTPEQEEAARRRRISDGAKALVLPDCCNLGIALRIIGPLNVAALALSFALSVSLQDAFTRFVGIAVLLEPVTLASMVLLCLVRKTVNGWKLPAQWAVAVGLPTLVSVPIALFGAGMIRGDAAVGSLGYWIFIRALTTAMVAYGVAEILRLRARAYSPSLSEARLQALQARIRPHFLFNSLNTVLGLMRGDPRAAERTLENLADLFRVFMKDTRELVPLDEEVVVCQQYLAIEQLRLGDRLRVRWELDEMPGDALLPSLLLQPLIENSVHHGIEPRTEVGEIGIRITHPGERVRVEIVNPLASQAPVRPGNQMALSNIRERLMLLYDMEAELRTTEVGDQFNLFLEFPYRKERRRRDVRRHFHPDR